MSMTYLQAANHLSEYFRDQWVANGRSQDLIAFEDRSFDTKDPAKDSYWVSIANAEQDSEQASLADYSGKACFERTNLFAVTIYTSRNGGLQLARQLAQEVVDMFERKTYQGIWFRNVRVNPIGADGLWYRYNVLTDLIFNQVK